MEKKLVLDKKSQTVIEYEPDNSIKKGYITIFSEIYNDIIKNKWLTYQLFKRDFIAMYKQSLVGIFWVFIMPVISVSTFIILKHSGIFITGKIRVPYSIYAITGIAIWQIFSTGLIISTNSLVKAGPMIVKINFSKKSLVIASMAQGMVNFLIQFVLIGILLIYYKILPGWNTLLFPVFLIPVILFTLGLAFIFALLNGVLRDIGNILPIAITFLMFLTPILYTKPSSGVLSYITKYNPLYYMISIPRDIILTGTLPSFQMFSTILSLSLITFTICTLGFHLTEPRIAERI